MKGMWLIVGLKDGIAETRGGWRGTLGHFWFYTVVKSSLAKMLAIAPQNKSGRYENESERCGTRTHDALIKSNAVKFPIFRASLKLESALLLLYF